MGPRFLIDTNTAIEFLAGPDHTALPPVSYQWVRQVLLRRQHALSVINRIELLSGRPTPTMVRVLEGFVAASLVLELDEDVVRQTVSIRQQHRRKLPDAVIAATALVHNLTVVSRNVADFRALAGLTILDPHDTTNLPQL